MKKNKNNKKGFAMAELLAISVAILLLFSILFSNYLPLVAEYESRLSYTNVTANYAAFYVRKVYKDAIESNTVYGNKTMQRYIDSAIDNQGYLFVYDKNGTSNLVVTGDTAEELLNVMDQYGVEEVIITKYKLDSVKGNSTLKQQHASLYRFIQYLPNYTQSNIGNTNTQETYRIILKTSNFGYATTQILAEPATPIECFKLTYPNGGSGFIIDEYLSQNENCTDTVSIPAGTIAMETSSNNSTKQKRGKIVAIGAHAFEPTETGQKPITSIYLPENVTSIGASAFKNNKLNKFSLKNNAPGVTSIGDYAFDHAFNDSDTANPLRITILDKNINGTQIMYGEGVFANNYKLNKIVFDFGGETGNQISVMSIPTNMFALTNKTKASSRLTDSLYQNIKLSIPYNIDLIGEGAFKNIKFSSIEFENQIGERTSNLKSIGASAFEIENDVIINNQNTYLGDDTYLRIIIPQTVQHIYDSAFKNVQIGDLTFETSESSSIGLEDIGDSAFATVQTNITNKVINDFCDREQTNGPCLLNEEGNKIYNRFLKIPVTVKKIGANAFNGQKLMFVAFNETDNNGNVVMTSSLNEIGNSAFSGNDFTTINLPRNLNVNKMGSKIFGDMTNTNISFGNIEGNIMVSDASMITSGTWQNKWCDILYGQSCQSEEEPNDEEDPSNIKTYKFTHNGVAKYVSYYG